MSVFDELFVRQKAVFTDPIARNEVLDVGNIVQRLQIRRPLVRIVLQAHQLDHVTAPAMDRRADRGFAASGGFFHVGLAGTVSRGALGVTQFYGPSLEPEALFLNFSQTLTSARQNRMSKRTVPCLVLGIFLPVSIHQTFATTTVV